LAHPEEGGQSVAETTDYRWVGQQAKADCCVAALAMITGHPYAQVRSFFPFVETDGMSYDEYAAYLRLFGYSVDSREQTYAHRLGSEPWPPAPFAPVHLCSITHRAGCKTRHGVVLFADGTVLDPQGPEPKQLSDYYQINRVVGITLNNSARRDLQEAEIFSALQEQRCYITRRKVKRSTYAILRAQQKKLHRSCLRASQFFVRHLCRWLAIDPARLFKERRQTGGGLAIGKDDTSAKRL